MSATESSPAPEPILEGLTVDEALDRARQLHRASRVDDAETIYVKVLEIVPDYPDALNFYGILKFQAGLHAEAIGLLRRCVEVAPHYHDAHANLGLMLRSTGDLASAESHLAIATQLKPGAVAPKLAQAMLKKSQGKMEEALALLEALIVEVPKDDLVRKALVELLQTMGRLDQAIAHYRAGDGMAGMDSLRIGLAYAEAKKGNFENARNQMLRWLALDPENPKPRHLLAAYGGAPVPERASDDMVRKTFDSFAESFNRQLEVLEYRAPELVDQTISAAFEGRNAPLDLLDAGCGTGLLAPRVRQRTRRLVGVDLSGRMLEKARALDLYDELHEAELTSYLASQQQSFDVVASADTLCYFGTLEAVFEAAHGALRPGGLLVFSVEHNEEIETGFLLQVHGRYCHRQDYVESALRSAGFTDLQMNVCTLRMEMLVPVRGLIATARRGT